eukprot:m.192634 g.192634  ORF g.192634 m.192634 type:complete len:359 (-) comp32475_c4_seq2:558-1634(-)
MENDHNQTVIAPTVIRIGNRQYRSNRPNPKSNVSEPTENQMSRISALDNDWEDGDIAGIEQMEDGRFTATVAVPSAFTGKLIGKKGEGKARLQQETQTTIVIPKRGGGENVRIIGVTQSGVDSCRTRIELLVESALKSAGVTHFLSIPLMGPDFESGLTTFKEQAMDVRSRGISDEIFVNHQKLHLTLGTLKMYSDAQIKQAGALLTECTKEIRRHLGGNPHILVRGVNYMNDDPSNVDVLYAKVALCDDDTDLKLQSVVDAISTRFIEAGLMEREFERDGVKLHATIMNSKWRRSSINETSNNSRNRERVSFDASAILKKCVKYTFGKSKFAEVHLSRMVARGKGTGYYEAEHIASV